MKSAPLPVSHRNTRQPKFIDGIYMDHHNKSSAYVNAVQPKRIPEKAKPTAKVYHPAPQKAIASTEPKVTYIVKQTRPAVVEKPVAEETSTKETNILFRKYAEMLEVKPKEIENVTLYSFIDKWYGADYKMGGCDISGIDCSGFAQKLYSDVFGVDLLRTSMEQFKNCKRIKFSRDAEESDLIFFHVRGKRISHVGVYLINDYFVHASTTSGVMISNLNEEYWRRTYAGIGRIPRG